MTRYLGPAHTLEWPKDSGNVYARGDPVPFSDEDITRLRGIGHNFEDSEGQYMGEHIPPPRQPDEQHAHPLPEDDPSKQPTQAAASGFTGSVQGGAAERHGDEIAREAWEASTFGVEGQGGEHRAEDPAQQTVQQGFESGGGEDVDDQTRVATPGEQQAPDTEMPTTGDQRQPEGHPENSGGLEAYEPAETRQAGVPLEAVQAEAEQFDESGLPKEGRPEGGDSGRTVE